MFVSLSPQLNMFNKSIMVRLHFKGVYDGDTPSQVSPYFTTTSINSKVKVETLREDVMYTRLLLPWM